MNTNKKTLKKMSKQMNKPRLSMKLLWQIYAQVADKETKASEFLFLVDQRMKNNV